MSLTKDDLIKTLAKENGYSLNQTVDLVKTLLENQMNPCVRRGCPD